MGAKLIKNLVKLAQYLNWKEFIVAFFIMSFATSLPNLFVGIGSALRGIPQLSFGDILGGDMVDLTLVMALAVLFGKGSLAIESRMVQKSVIFTSLAAMLPLLLIFDGDLSRIDGIILLFAFLVYSFWLFSKADRFKKIYDENENQANSINFLGFLKILANIIFLLAVLLLASQAIIQSAQVFSSQLHIPLALIGLLIVGLGNAFPEAYLSIISSRKGENWLILGNLMGSVIVCSTLVLGTVALIAPIHIPDFSPFLIARIFTIITAFLFFVIARSGRKITKKEALILIFIYISFLITEIFRPYFF
ncbi:MAG: inner membrane protein [Parcubacteria group bacterium Licking1014_1]|nr:MAG: inner membrane protein [Parcubacteria group bacterium Licking1014_1]